MGKSYKRNSDDDFDDVSLFDEELEVDDDIVDWILRPNAVAKSDRKWRVPRVSSRSLPADWRDFDYGGGGGDPFDSPWH